MQKIAIRLVFRKKSPRCTYGYTCGFSSLQTCASHQFFSFLSAFSGCDVYRISVDFDLFSPDDIGKNFLSMVEKVFSESAVSLLANNPDELSVLVDGVKLTFLKYHFPIVNGLVDLDGMQALGIPELAATKAYTIGRRGSLKDYVDLYYILSDALANLERIIDLAEKKFGGEFNSRVFLEQLIYFDDVGDESILFLKNPVSKAQLEKFFIKEVRGFKL